MIIQVKTLQNSKFDLEIEPTDTVAQIKERIHKELNLGEPESQKLIHRGKILKDDQTAQSVGFKEKDFLVVMVKKQKKKDKDDTEETEQTTSSEPTTTTTTSTTTTSTTSSSPSLTTQSTTTNSNQASEQSAASTLVTGTELQSTVQNLMNMGFDREQVMHALRAAYNNPDRAVEYLLNGLPTEQQQQQEPPSEPSASTRSASLGQQRQAPRTASTQPQSTQSSQSQSSQPSQAQSGGGGGQNPMANLQQVIQGNPQLLAGMIAQLAQQNPELLQAIQQNPQALQQVLNDPQIMQQLMGMMLLQQLQQGGGGDEEDGYEDDGSGDANPLGGINPPAGVIQVTSAEKQAIDRLKALVGCSEAQAAEAYMVCDKNEELAASYLVENSLGTSAFDLPRTTAPSNQSQSQNQSSQSRNNSGNDNNDNTGSQNDNDTS